jgi:hypothetical protein
MNHSYHSHFSRRLFYHHDVFVSCCLASILPLLFRLLMIVQVVVAVVVVVVVLVCVAVHPTNSSSQSRTTYLSPGMVKDI